MNIECLVTNIEKTLPLLTKVIPTYSQAPILSNILLEAKQNGLFISATDLEIGVQVVIPAKVIQEGAVTISGKHFSEAITSLPKDKITLTLERDELILTSPTTRLSFATISQDEFPHLFDTRGEEILRLTQAEFKNFFSPLLFAVSADESRPQLTGVYIQPTDDGCNVVATDGYRLSLKRTVLKLATSDSFILSSRLIHEAFLLKSDGDLSIFYYKDGNQIVIESTDATLVGRLIAGEFPPYERVIPSSSATKVTIVTDEFEQALKTASVFARDNANILKLSIQDGKMTLLSASLGVGQGQVSIDVVKEGPDVEVSFNVKYLLDLLRNVDSKHIEMGLNSSLEPGIFRNTTDPTFLHVVMPVRIQE